VVGDNAIALEAAFGAGPGLVVIAGTGSIAYGRNPKGQTARAGGWGWAISDEGSAHWIGRAAVALAMRAHDAGETTLLVSSIMNSWHLGTREDVVRAANSTPPANFAALFPAVLAAAQEGDSLAREVLMEAGAELAQLAKIVLRRLWPTPEPPVGVATSGGVFHHAPLVRHIFGNTLRSEYATVELRPGVVDAAAGALALARRMTTESPASA
jgi:N-acetylglucosamine kinase-like BadF-type ATPase